ncbi:MAG: mandelate racemase/muconate lactonizing enzyme family protein [Chloroflexi bacterium]|nr:mandelate racemase/muconate lactonizing enzyme family protein [Chloroflexota bacterium]
MKIEAIETLLFHTWFVVRVHTEEGVSGIGQTAFWGYADASERVVDAFRDLLIGEDPLRIEHHWQRMFRSAPFRGGALSGAVSAVDMALWDIAGKRLDVPAYQLMGGRQRDRIRLHLLLKGKTRDEWVAAAAAARDEGFTAVKFDPLPEDFQNMSHGRMIQEVVDNVAAVREEVGWDVDILAEIHRKLGPGEAVALAGELERFRLYLYEDAILHDSEDSWAEIAAKIRIPMGTGERNHTIYEFRELLSKGAVQFVRPDIGLAGGLTHCKKIATVAESFHAQVVMHNYLSPLLTAASVQLYAAIPNAGTLEYDARDTERPGSEMLLQPLEKDGGYLLTPDRPGLGVELDDRIVAKYPFHRQKETPSYRTDGSYYTR